MLIGVIRIGSFSDKSEVNRVRRNKISQIYLKLLGIGFRGKENRTRITEELIEVYESVVSIQCQN